MFEFDQSFNIHRNRMLLLSTTYVSDRNPLCNVTRGWSQHFDWVWYASLLRTWYENVHTRLGIHRIYIFIYYTSQTKSNILLSSAMSASSCLQTFSICYFWRQEFFLLLHGRRYQHCNIQTQVEREKQKGEKIMPKHMVH